MGNSFIVDGHRFEHNERRWRVDTNRHPQTNGDSWGWIEGADGNVTWSGRDGYARAQRATSEHNAWLDAQEPPRLKLIRLTRDMNARQNRVDALRRQLSSEEGELAVLLARVTSLRIEVGEASTAPPTPEPS